MCKLNVAVHVEGEGIKSSSRSSFLFLPVLCFPEVSTVQTKIMKSRLRTKDKLWLCWLGYKRDWGMGGRLWERLMFSRLNSRSRNYFYRKVFGYLGGVFLKLTSSSSPAPSKMQGLGRACPWATLLVPVHRRAGGRGHVAVLLTLLLGVRANTVGK